MGALHTPDWSSSPDLVFACGSFIRIYELAGFGKLQQARWLQWKTSEAFVVLRQSLGFVGDNWLCDKARSASATLSLATSVERGKERVGKITVAHK